MNETIKSIIGQLHESERVWNRVKDRLDLISLKRSPKDNYGIFFNGIFTGLFVCKQFVDKEELKEMNWKIEGKMEV